MNEEDRLKWELEHDHGQDASRIKEPKRVWSKYNEVANSRVVYTVCI